MLFFFLFSQFFYYLLILILYCNSTTNHPTYVLTHARTQSNTESFHISRNTVTNSNIHLLICSYFHSCSFSPYSNKESFVAIFLVSPYFFLFFTSKRVFLQTFQKNVWNEMKKLSIKIFEKIKFYQKCPMKMCAFHLYC